MCCRLKILQVSFLTLVKVFLILISFADVMRSLEEFMRPSLLTDMLLIKLKQMLTPGAQLGT